VEVFQLPSFLEEEAFPFRVDQEEDASCLEVEVAHQVVLEASFLVEVVAFLVVVEVIHLEEEVFQLHFAFPFLVVEEAILVQEELVVSYQEVVVVILILEALEDLEEEEAVPFLEAEVDLEVVVVLIQVELVVNLILVVEVTN
jgi:hypothetical protein